MAGLLNTITFLNLTAHAHSLGFDFFAARSQPDGLLATPYMWITYLFYGKITLRLDCSLWITAVLDYDSLKQWITV